MKKLIHYISNADEETTKASNIIYGISTFVFIFTTFCISTTGYKSDNWFLTLSSIGYLMSIVLDTYSMYISYKNGKENLKEQDKEWETF